MPVSIPYGNFKFSYSVSGFGTSGVSTGQFDFDLWDEFGHYGEAILAGVSARLYERNNAVLPSREYYISKRSINNKLCHITAYNLMSKTDEPLDISVLNHTQNMSTSNAQFVQLRCAMFDLGRNIHFSKIHNFEIYIIFIKL